MVGVCGAPYKCPPAPSECVLMLHDYLVRQGVRAACEISLVLPLGSPVPPSPDTSRALLAAFAERDIKFIPSRRVASVDNARDVAILDDGTQMPFDLFLGVPRHRVPPVVPGKRHVGERLDSGQSAHPGNEIRKCLRGRRRRQHRHA
jgi:sulfide:quinone oxidoreductase